MGKIHREYLGDASNLVETIIDYDKKEIRVVHSNRWRSGFDRFLLEYGTLFFLFSCFFLFSLVAYVTYLRETTGNTLYSATILDALAAVSLGFWSTAVYSFVYKKMYPQLWNKLQSKMSAYSPHKMKITKIPTKDFVLSFKKFNNLVLKYRCTEDYSRYLRRIHILKLDKDKREDNMFKNWGVHFSFRKLPLTGEMALTYK